MAKQQENPSPNVRIGQLRILNYRAIDSLVLELPRPSTRDELDVFALGSRNGVGKTSVLECCALAVGGASGLFSKSGRLDYGPSELQIRGAAERADIHAKLLVGTAEHEVHIEVARTSVRNSVKPHPQLAPRKVPYRPDDELMESLLGVSSEPLVEPPLLFFHSYRKIQEGSSPLGAMLEDGRTRKRAPPWRLGGPGPLSIFKISLVKALMARSGMFEGLESQADSEEVTTALNRLILQFAGGKVDKLRPGPDGTLELRVAPTTGGPSFSFDGLSSGQKEIIATLFLIWHATHHRPSVVLIDEPELHLNAEWQRQFVYQLGEIAPQNQYILATHSEEVFASVSDSRRLLLHRDG